jgi:hypothetical protein
MTQLTQPKSLDATTAAIDHLPFSGYEWITTNIDHVFAPPCQHVLDHWLRTTATTDRASPPSPPITKSLDTGHHCERPSPSIHPAKALIHFIKSLLMRFFNTGILGNGSVLPF